MSILALLPHEGHTDRGESPAAMQPWPCVCVWVVRGCPSTPLAGDRFDRRTQCGILWLPGSSLPSPRLRVALHFFDDCDAPAPDPNSLELLSIIMASG